MAVNLEQIGTRLSFFMKLKGVGLHEMGIQTETSEKVIQNIISGKNYVMEDLLVVLNHIPNLNPHWLIYGEGNIFRDEAADNTEHDKMALLKNRQKHLLEMQRLMEELDKIEKDRTDSSKSKIEQLKARIFDLTKEL
ncbi:MAG: hypothetical protein LPJ89_07565 [Hymenobacteraceae bacterium]|nr:hypothetical protein [Hymenobacteraceae bacterium]